RCRAAPAPTPPAPVAKLPRARSNVSKLAWEESKRDRRTSQIFNPRSLRNRALGHCEDTLREPGGARLRRALISLVERSRARQSLASLLRVPMRGGKPWRLPMNPPALWATTSHENLFSG